MAYRELVEFIAKKLVTHQESVQVRLIEGEAGQTLQLSVDDSDIGGIIGRNGRTIKAIRTLLFAASTKSQTKVGLEVINTTDGKNA
ncbi:MAG: KH domain-containing protein [Candidatus Hydrogenedentales bacterium]|jgi:predicted RNA-binding protein YlqC (UPF0109 family)